MNEYISKNAVMSTLQMMMNNIDEKHKEHENDVLDIDDLAAMLMGLRVIYGALPVKRIDDGTESKDA